MKNLIVAAHYDDETLGCYSILENADVIHICKGRSLSNYLKRKNAFLSFFKNNNFEIETCFRDLELNWTDIPKIADFLSNFKYDRVFIHNENDIHQDHVLVSKACKVAFRKQMCEVLEFNVQSNLKFNNLIYDTISLLTKKQKCDKIKSLKLFEENIDYNIENKEYFKTLFRVLN